MPYFETSGNISLDLTVGNNLLELRIKDVEGHYTIPYIQSSDLLEVNIKGAPRQVFLSRGNHRIEPEGKSGHYNTFKNLSPGEYKLVVDDITFSPVGIGTVIAALGDSITEGYHGHWFRCECVGVVWSKSCCCERCCRCGHRW